MARKKQSGVEILAAHPGWRTRKKQDLVVFLEGGLVRDVVDLNAKQPTRGVPYETMDWDIFDGDVPADETKEYVQTRSKKLLAYIKKYLPREHQLVTEALAVDVDK